MNLILLFEDDFVAEGVVRLTGRRRDHLLAVQRASAGDALVVGLEGGRIGRGTVTAVGEEGVEMEVVLDLDPPPPLELTLVVALPRPKVLSRLIASVTSLGVKRLFLINSWRVDKSYWKTPRLAPESIREQCVLGLEQARDTVIPAVELRRLFRPFLEEELPALASGTTPLVAHPYAEEACPGGVPGRVTAAIGPEGGFIAREIESFQRIGFRPVALGPRILRVETAVAAMAGRLA